MTRYKQWYLNATMIVTMAIVMVITIIVADHRVSQSEHAFCPILLVLDQTYRATPPTTPTGRQIAADFDRIVVEYGCT